MKYNDILVGQLSGSLGGVTASRNRYGTYLRKKATPVNPATPFQEVVRQAFRQLPIAWTETLTDAQRSEWDSYAQHVPLVGADGQPVFLNGQTHYIRSNVPRLQLGLARVDDAPATQNLGTFTAPTIDSLTAATELLSLNFTETDEWVDETGSIMVVRGSRPTNPTVNFFKGPYRQTAGVPGDETTPPTSPASITLPFGFAVGQRVHLAVAVSRADGRLTQPFRLAGLGV